MSELTHGQVLDRIIDEGIAAAKSDYASEEKKPHLEGSVAGFEACRGLSPRRLFALLSEAREKTLKAYAAQVDPENYWYIRCMEAEVEWVCNCISVILANEGLPVIIPPTARAVMKVAEIVGVAGMHEGPADA